MNKSKRVNAFHFKQFSIIQEGCGMPVSTDGVMLGSWFNFTDGQYLLDIGTGTGLLALMAAQRFPLIEIDAIDIDLVASQIASVNVNQSEWSNRISVKQQDLLSYKSSRIYDAIVCNPPYFTSGESARKTERATARHAHDLSHNQLLARCDSLLSQQGKASFVLPESEGIKMINDAQKQGWHLSRLWRIKTTPNKPVSRLLFELSKQNSATLEERNLIIQKEDNYSGEFIELTNAFYLKM